MIKLKGKESVGMRKAFLREIVWHVVTMVGLVVGVLVFYAVQRFWLFGVALIVLVVDSVDFGYVLCKYFDYLEFIERKKRIVEFLKSVESENNRPFKEFEENGRK